MSKINKLSFTPKNSIIILLLISLFLLPFVGLSSYVLYMVSTITIYSVLALGLNILVGYSGQISIGHAGFAAIGAYTAGALLNSNVTPLLAILFAGIIAGFFGFLMGFPATKLSGHYLAIITLVFALAVGELIVILDKVTGGFTGLSVTVPHPFFIALPQSIERYFFILIISLILIWSATKFLSTKTGRAFNAVRSGEIAAAAMGIKPSRYKIIAFVISSVFAGIAGALIAINAGYLHPADFSVFTSIIYLGMVVVGGQGSVLGSILGAVLFGFAPELLADFQSLATACLGVIIIVCMKVSPMGLAALIKNKKLNFSKRRARSESQNEQKEVS